MGSPSRDLYEVARVANDAARAELGDILCSRCGAVSNRLALASLAFDGALYADPARYCPSCLSTLQASGLTVTVLVADDPSC